MEAISICNTKNSDALNHYSFKEEWKPHPMYPLYLISNYGKVKRLSYITRHNRKRKEHIFVNITKNDGYEAVSILTDQTDPASRKLYPLHRLVAETFIPNPEKKKEINHIDGIKSNNTVPNLEWCTRSENVLHSFSHGLEKMTFEIAQKISISNLKLTPEEEKEILNIYKTGGYSIRALARIFHHSRHIIKHVVRGTYHTQIKKVPESANLIKTDREENI